MSYDKVVEKIQQNDLSWGDIDRILLNPDTYEEFRQRASFDPSNYATNDKPAVRETTGQEKIIYVPPNGMQVTINL